MTRKAPRRTAERILEVALEQFNRFGEPNVSTTMLAAALGISAGNLYYHFPAKDGLVNALFDRYAEALGRILPAASDVRDAEDAWFFLHSLFERLWDYRFLYRDVGELLSRNRKLEAQLKQLLDDKSRALRELLAGLEAGGAARIDPHTRETTATSMVVVLTWWLSYEFVQDPRHALEDAGAASALARGASHVLHLLVPYLEPGQQRHLLGLAQGYQARAA